MDYTVIKQRRKTATISIDAKLNIIVKVPLYMTKKQIQQLVTKQEAWILETLDKKKKLIETQDWYYTGKILYMGEYREIKRIKTSLKKSSIDFNDKGFIIVSDGSEEVQRQLVEKFFRKQAKEQLTGLADFYAKKIGVQYHKITIRNQVTRWGSCSSKGNLSFNLKVMCAPKEMIEYVVLHEVMHLKHFDHSKAFWQSIEEVMPNYKVCVNYFKQYGQNFMI